MSAVPHVESLVGFDFRLEKVFLRPLNILELLKEEVWRGGGSKRGLHVLMHWS